jgi:hypothetical protein
MAMAHFRMPALSCLPGSCGNLRARSSHGADE